MELKWLDDYIALIETGSFSAAAARRHVSQPAFSRRIQMLEAWLGVTLIDRTRKPLQFTPVATENQAAFRSLVARIYEFRAVLKSESLDSAGITIAAQHTLATAYLPAFLARLQRLSPGQSYRIRSENRTDSVTMLMRGQAEILITYETAQTRCGIPAPMARREVLGSDELMLVASPALHTSLNRLREGDPVPMLCFPPESFFGQVVRVEALPELMRRQPVVVRCVSEFAMGLRELALIGQGAAWLPGSLISDDLRRGRLRPLPDLGRSVAMDIVVYFATPGGDQGAGLAARIEAFRDQRPARGRRSAQDARRHNRVPACLPTARPAMQMICLDLEGVLVPEIWIAFAQRTGIAEFRRTTRDEPDYDRLMRYRLDLLRQHGLKLGDIQAVIAGMAPLEGAREFLDDLRARYQVIILSDTFYEFADPLMQQLGRPTLFCHRLVVDDAGYVADYRLRQPDQKRHAVNALKSLNYQVIAAGDSYNDTAMLGVADAGFFIHPPPGILAQFPQFPVNSSYAELKASIDTAAARLRPAP